MDISGWLGSIILLVVDSEHVCSHLQQKSMTERPSSKVIN